MEGDFYVEGSQLSGKSSFNLCLDSQPGSKFYAIYENGKLGIHNADELLK